MANTQGIRAGRAFVEVGMSDKLSAGLRRAQQRLKAFGASVQSMGMGLVRGAAAALVPLTASGVVFAGFESRMARVKALTGASGKDFKRLADAAKEMGQSTVFSASQAAEAMGVFAQAGFDVEQILKAINPTLSLAAAGQIEIAEAADITAKTMQSMQIEAANLGNTVDVLTKAMTTANTDLIQLGDALKYIGPLGNFAGYSLEEVVAAVQLLSNAGIQAEMAGTTLRGMLNKLTTQTPAAAEQIKKLTNGVADAQGNVRPLVDILGDLEASMANMGSAEKLDVLGKIFGARPAAGAAVLLSQGADKLREYTQVLKGAGGTAARIASTQLNTLTGDVTILKSAIEGLAITVGESLTGPVRVAAQAISKVVTTVSAWISENRELVVMAGAAAVALGGLGAGLVALGVGAKVAAFVFGGLAMAVAAVKFTAVAVGAVFTALLAPIGLAVAAMSTLDAAVVGFAFAALVYGGVAKEAFTSLGTAVVVFSDAVGAALDWLRERFNGLRRLVGDVVSGITDALAAGEPALAAKVMWAGLKVAWEAGIHPLRAAWNTFRYVFEEVGINAFAVLKGGWIEVSTWMWKNFPETTAFIAKTWAGLTSSLRSIWARFQNWLSDRWLEVFGWFNEDLDVKAAQALGRQDLNADLADIDKQYAKDVAEAERKKGLTPEEHEAEKKASLAQVEADRQKALGELETAHLDRVAAANKALADARKELADARNTAKQKREEADAAAAKTATAGGPPPPPDPKDQLKALGGQQMGVIGTFNPAAAFGLGASGALERTARAAEEIEKEIKQLDEKLRTAGATFAP